MPLLVVAVAISDGAGCVLMQSRPQDKQHGGLWEFPGGKLEPGETPQEAACREIAEELDLVLKQGDLQEVGFACGRASGGVSGSTGVRPIVLLLYCAKRWQGMPQSQEGQGIEWVRFDELKNLAMPPLDYPLAEQLCTFLQKDAIIR